MLNIGKMIEIDFKVGNFTAEIEAFIRKYNILLFIDLAYCLFFNYR